MEWKTSAGLVPYEEALAFMEERVRAIRENGAEEMIWLLEHPPLFTAGTSAAEGDLLDSLGFPVYRTGRGGQYTYHGPGQRVAYLMLDLEKRGKDVRAFVKNLERWITGTLAALGVQGFTREGRIGVWVNTPTVAAPAEGVLHDDPAQRGGALAGAGRPLEKKIAAIGIRLRRWVSYHGISINVNPDLAHYRGIVSCGLRDYGVTSLAGLGKPASMPVLDKALSQEFNTIFS